MKVLIAAGGTAGHINPGLAIAKYIKQKIEGVEILFIGTKRGLETKLIPIEGFNIKYINVRGFRRKISIDTLVAIKELFQGTIEARRIIKDFQPDIVIGTGGYVCGPVLLNASRMKIPTLIHEQNAYPGITNKILSRFVNAVAISFKEARSYFKSAKNVVLTGNPIRSELFEEHKLSAKKSLKIVPRKQLVVIFGGSRGAHKINEVTSTMLKENFEGKECNIIFATGDNEYQEILQKLDGMQSNLIKIIPYIYNMGTVMAAADLVIGRSGAITLSELTVLGVPSILIPSPNVTANHQEYNARALEEQGAAVVITEDNLTSELLYKQMMNLLSDKDQLSKMSKSAKKMGITNATEKIFSLMNEIMAQKE